MARLVAAVLALLLAGPAWAAKQDIALGRY